LPIFVWALTAAYALIFTLLGAWRYAVHRNLVDFGIFAQTIAGAFGCFCNAIEGNHWAYHFSPILYVAGVLLRIAPSPYMIVAIQACACALTIPPVYGIVARRAGAGAARFAAIVVFLYPPLAGLTFNDFHENGFAPAAVAWMLWAFDGDYLVAAALLALVVLAIKEDQAAFLAVAGAIGARLYWGSRRGRLSLSIAIVSVLVFVGFFAVIQPAFREHWSPTRFYAWDAHDAAALFPGGILERLGFFVLAFAPLGFLPFRSGMMWLAAAPLAEVLLSRNSTTFTIGSHYAGAWIGYVLVAFAFALRELELPRATGVLRWCAALCVLELLVADPLHPGLNLRPLQPRDRALDAALARVPHDVPLSTQEEAYTHLALNDPDAGLLPEFADRRVCTPLVLIDTAFPASARLEEYGQTLRGLVRRRVYVRLERRGDVELYRRTKPCRYRE
jgi:uncharacterized membrane protein